MSIPDSSIEGIKPTIKPIPKDMLAKKDGVIKRCCICGNIPSKLASYSIQGAVVIQRYCDSCAEKEFSL